MKSAPSALQVLLIEDNPADVLLLEEAFADLPEVEVVLKHVERLAVGLDSLGAQAYDVVLLDLGLPDSQGIETFARLHAQHPEVPVLVLTALDDESVGVNALQAGAQDYLVKRRLEAPLLVRSVRYAIERHRNGVELDRRARELAESEERFELALSGSAAGLWDWNLRTDEVFFSPRFKQLLGFAPEDFPDEMNAYLERIHPDDRARVRARRVEHLEHRTPFDVEFRVIARSGEERWVQSRAQALWDAAGAAYRMVGWIIDVTERKRDVESLRLFRRLIDHSNDAIEVIDPVTARLLDVNERDVLDLGYARDELLRLRVFDLDPTITPARWSALVARARERRGLRAEGVHRRKDGSTFPVEFSVQWVDLDRSYLVAIVRDIAERKATEQSLRFHEAVLAETGRIARVGGWSFDPRTGEGHWSDEVARIHDLEPKTATSFRFGLQFYAGEDRRRIEAAVERAVKQGQPYDLELELTSARGVRKWVRTIGHPVVENGVVVRVHGSFQDITDRVEAVRRIRRQADLLNRASDAIILRDLEMRVQFWSQGAERLYGWTEAEAKGRDLTERLFRDAKVIEQPLAILRRSGEWNGELQQVRKDGRAIVVQARWTLLLDAHGEPEAVLSINTDVTAQKELEARFLRTQRLESIGTLAGGIAHDFNNVLSPIMMALALLRSRHPDEESARLIDMLEASARRGRDLVRQVLGFSRGLDGERILLQPGHILREVGQIAADTFPKSIEVGVDCAKDTWVMRGDPTQVHQVLMNLCVNARDAMPAGGRLRLELGNVKLDETYAQMHPEATPGPHVCLTVSDQGGGIAPEVRGRIFEPFFTTKEAGQGTGLGLSTVRGIVRSHGGFIELYSEVGRGTTFRVYFPASETESVALPAGQTEALEALRGHGEMILVVDDEAAIRRVATRTLERFGYRVLTAANGAEGVSSYVLHRHEIAVVLTDIAMPVMDGLAMAHALRAIAPELPIVGTTGLAGAGTEAHLRELNVTHFLPKPYVAEHLLRSLRELIRGDVSAES